MRSPIRSLSIFARKFARDRRGATAAIFALAVIPIVGVMGLAIDVGNAIRVQYAVQASTDAAALAGAQSITNNTNDVAAKVTLYSSAAGQKNVIPNVAVSTNVTLKCFNTTGATCAGVSGAYNGLVVVQTATVPTYFAKIFGINSFPVSATATAGAAGSKPVPLNVMIVLDATGSMGQTDPNCGGLSKLNCALSGVQSLLGILAPSVDQVGLMVFPAFTSGTASRATDCNSGTNPSEVDYSASNRSYQIVAPAQDYRGSDTTTTLASGTPLVSATGGGCSGNGIQPITGGGIDTFFAEAIWQAQTALVATDPTATTQNVIVFLSDGDSNSTHVMNATTCPTNSSAWCVGGEQNNQCHAAIRAAHAAAAAGTWVFSIAYDSITVATGSCSTDLPHISACTTMTQIASDTSKFYSDSTGAVSPTCTSSVNSFTSLLALFNAIGHALQQPRLFANNTT